MTASQDTTVKVWSLGDLPDDGSDASSKATLHHPKPLNKVCFSTDVAVTTCWDGKLRVWSLDTYTCLRALDDGVSKSWLNGAHIVNGFVIASGADQRYKDGTVMRIWSLATGKALVHLATCRRHSHPIQSITVTPNGSILTASAYQCVVWHPVAANASERGWHEDSESEDDEGSSSDDVEEDEEDLEQDD